MKDSLFTRGDILLPEVQELQKWSVIACDQFSSEPEYWAEVEEIVKDAPSSLRLMLPELYLREGRGGAEGINASMRRYLDGGVFRTIPDSFVYLERRLSGGELRRGLVGLLDLESYDFSPGSTSAIRATEGTVPDRLPIRIELREDAPLEMPHTVVFIDDPEDSVMSLAGKLKGEKLYDFELMQQGGHLTGWRVSGDSVSELEKAIDELSQKSPAPQNAALPVIAVGDGNHSLAAAKLCWEEIKASLPPEKRTSHPARYSLVELTNLHEPSVVFSPIHRVVFDTESKGFADSLADFLGGFGKTGGARSIRAVCEGEEREIQAFIPEIGRLIALCDEFLLDWCDKHGGRIDYIHGESDAQELSRGKCRCGVILPPMDKAELFINVSRAGVFPRKSFSIGSARDKRYYLECRKIK